MKHGVKIILISSLLLMLLSSFSLSFPVSLVGEEIGRAYGFPIPWHIKDVVSLGRVVWVLGLLVNILAYAFLSVGIYYLGDRLPVLSIKINVVFKAIIVISAIFLTFLMISNFIDPSFRMLKPGYDFSFKNVGFHFGPYYN